MKRALILARRGKGKTNPNPLVGAVVVKGNRVVGEGYHRRAGLAHAEVAALKEAGEGARGATLYVNIEPCSHYGRTPPCTEEIIRSGLKRVVAAMLDPNPLNHGRGVGRLRSARITTTVGVLEEDARLLNEVFVKFVTQRVPFVTVKVAQSLDGKIATGAGDSRWITDGAARKLTHRLRSESDAVLVGIKTVLRDDPRLNVRLGKKAGTKQPLRIILDSHLRISPEARVFSAPRAGKVTVVTSRNTKKAKIRRLEKAGAEVLVLPDRDGRVSLRRLMEELAKREISHVLIEGGGEVIASGFREKLVDRVQFFIAPKIIGGKDAPTSVAGSGIRKINQALQLKDTSVRKIGPDYLVGGRVVYSR